MARAMCKTGEWGGGMWLLHHIQAPASRLCCPNLEHVVSLALGADLGRHRSKKPIGMACAGLDLVPGRFQEVPNLRLPFQHKLGWRPQSFYLSVLTWIILQSNNSNF